MCVWKVQVKTSVTCKPKQIKMWIAKNYVIYYEMTKKFSYFVENSVEKSLHYSMFLLCNLKRNHFPFCTAHNKLFLNIINVNAMVFFILFVTFPFAPQTNGHVLQTTTNNWVIVFFYIGCTCAYVCVCVKHFFCIIFIELDFWVQVHCTHYSKLVWN